MAKVGKLAPDTQAAPRQYDSPVRRKRTARTRGRILSAGADLARDTETWDWSDLTFRAVAERVGISERTVYRYFPTEHDLHTAVMARLTEEAGVDYSQVTLDTMAATAARVFDSIGAFAAAKEGLPRPSAMLKAGARERREALMRAVGAEFPDESHEEQVAIGATLDILWNTASHALLVQSWGMTPKEATMTIGWAIDAIRSAIAGRTDRP
jgi:AcrR family transcriptional regulator